MTNERTCFRPYPHYKPSGVEWLSYIPAHWEVRRTKSLLKERSQKGFPNEPLLAATQTKGVVRKEHYENRTVLALRDLHLMKLVYPGDFVISLRSFQGGIEYARDRGIISPAYTILYPENPDIHGYLAWLFKSKPYIENLILHVTGIRQGQNIDYGRLCVSKIPLPPFAEQPAIVRYLDQADERIRGYISSRERLIELLEEYRQAVIHHAVTRGLDPDVRLKPSSVEWLGDVPAHWEVLPLKHWLGMNESVLSEATDPNFEFRYIDIGSVGTGVLIEKPQKIRFATAPSRARRIVRDGDTIISTVRTYLKAVWFDEETKGNFICSTGFVVLTPRQGTLPKFVSYLTQNNSFIDRVTANSVGTAYPAITESRLGSFQVAVPPFPEQAAIVAYLDNVTANIDAAIDRARREIELLSEYRIRLIADVVTGKVDVREVAAELSEPLFNGQK